jgi:thiol-disulfide isomerase/thioredoxin
MGKASRNKRGSARERIAAQQAAARQAERRNRMLWTGGAILGVIVIVVAFIVIKTTQSPTSAANAASSTSVAGTALPASVIKDITTVPASTFTSVNTGTADPKAVAVVSSAKPLASGGKPEVLYVGAEYCPYCATERWAMAVALSRFGTFTGLHGIHSSSSDVYANTPTLTFYKSKYTSPYLTFTSVEQQGLKEGSALEKTTAAQNALLTKYDSPPYVSASERGAIPFIDFGGKYFIHGAQYNPQVLSGQTWAQVAAALKDPSSAISKGAIGAANMITATICKTTNNQPSNVCTTPTIKTIEGQI